MINIGYLCELEITFLNYEEDQLSSIKLTFNKPPSRNFVIEVISNLYDNDSLVSSETTQFVADLIHSVNQIQEEVWPAINFSDYLQVSMPTLVKDVNKEIRAYVNWKLIKVYSEI